MRSSDGNRELFAQAREIEEESKAARAGAKPCVVNTTIEITKGLSFYYDLTRLHSIHTERTWGFQVSNPLILIAGPYHLLTNPLVEVNVNNIPNFFFLC